MDLPNYTDSERLGEDYTLSWPPMLPTTRNLTLLASLLVALLLVPASAQAGCPSAGSSSAQLSTDQAQDTIRCLLNGARKGSGARKLKQRGALDASAQHHASEMASLGYFSHTSPSGDDVRDRAEAFGYVGRGKGMLAEIIAAGQDSPAEVVRAWVASDPHRVVILDRRLRHVGVGIGLTTNPFDVFYSVSFGNR